MSAPLGVDPGVSRLKFEREICAYRALESTYQKRGWWLMRAEFPEALVAMMTTRGRPQILAFAALITFSDYDVAPPSVALVDPFTEKALTREEVATATPMLRRTSSERPPQAFVQLQGEQAPVGVDLILQGFEGEPPFLCVPGTREYHDNPAHTGDSWLFHRGRGAGTLLYILEQLWLYGTNPVEGLEFQIQAQMKPRISHVVP